VAMGQFLSQFLVSWLLFVVLSHSLAGYLNKQAHWPRFIAVWAYCSVIENVLVAVGSLPGPLGAPAVVSEACLLIAIGWALWLEWYAARLTLQISGWMAAGIVLGDLVIGNAMAALTMLSG
jgi:hypothetical protein